MLEIESNEAGWSGYMKLGLTQMDPSARYPLPAFSKPHLVDAVPCRSWIFPVHSNMDYSDRPARRISSRRRRSVTGSSSSGSQEPSSSSDTEGACSSPSEYNCSEYSPEEVEDSFQELSLTTTRSTSWNSGYVLPTDVGSQVGVVYRVNQETGLADMHFILNGMDRGIKAASIPYKDSPLFAVVDVYGTTKKLRIVSESRSLQSACRDVILNRLSGDVSQLPLPKKLKKFLRQKMASCESGHQD